MIVATPTARPRLVLGFDAEDRRSLLTMALGAAVIIPAAAFLLGGIEAGPPESLRRVPDFGPLLHAKPMILAHLAVALAALGGGVGMLAMRKGGRTHKKLGRLWAAVMIGAAVSGVLVEPNRFTPAHATALIVFAMIPLAIAKVRKGDLRGHRRTIAYLLIAMVIVAGLSFMPGHTLHGVLFRPLV